MHNAGAAKRLAALLKACGSSRDIETGSKLHLEAIESGLGSNLLVANSLVSMYAKCGSMSQARNVFDSIHFKDVVSWNSLLVGYVQNGDSHLALDLFWSMQQPADSRTFVAALMACSNLAAQASSSSSLKLLLEMGTRIHFQAQSSGCVSDIFISSKLIDMYAKCGSMVDARRVSDRIPCHNVVSWTALVLGYVENEQPEFALELFSKMDGFSAPSPDGPAFVAAFMACSSLARQESAQSVSGWLIKLKSLERGMPLHARAAKQGLVSSMYVATGVLDMYTNCGNLLDARRIFDSMAFHDVVLWNSLVLGYVENGEAELALQLFWKMDSANARTYVAALMACVNLAVKECGQRVDGKPVKVKALESGRLIHSRAAASGLHTEAFVANSLVDMYARCGSLDDARDVLDTIEAPNPVSWTALLLGYVDSGKCQEALELFRHRSFTPDAPAFVAAMVASGRLIDLQAGKNIQAETYRYGVIKDEEIVSSCLVDFYSRCGIMSLAQLVFDSVASFKNNATAAWNSLIAGYSHQGETSRVFTLLHDMREEGVRPNAITFYVILSACSHAGLVDKGKMFFQIMSSKGFGVPVEAQHYSCVIDLLGRANRLDEVLELLGKMPERPDRVTWMTVLSACWKWRNVAVGELAFQSLLKLDGENAAPYVLMSNIYNGVAFSTENVLEDSPKVTTGALAIRDRVETPPVCTNDRPLPDP